MTANTDHFANFASYYDYDCTATEDVPFYLDLARSADSPILELACGTGRILIPIAEAGFDTWGLDLSEPMLEKAREKIRSKGLASRVHLIHGDMAGFDLPAKDFGLVFIAFRSFMHLYSQEAQLACLTSAWAHLRPGGYLVVDVYSPLLHILASPPDQPFKVRREYTLPNSHRIVRKDRFVKNDYLNQINHSENLWEEFDSSGTLVRTSTMSIMTRYSFRYELHLLLEKAGFEIVNLFGSYDHKPYDATGEIIFVAQRKEPARAGN